MVEANIRWFGERGLQKEDADAADVFQAENERSAAKRHMNGDKQMIQKAAVFADKAHEGMIRKGAGFPYIYHPCGSGAHCGADDR